MYSPDPALASYQKALLAHMKAISAILTEAGVWHSLSSGSLLGAVREKGFIAWDDDIDLMVRYEDVEAAYACLVGREAQGIAVKKINGAYLKTWDLTHRVKFKKGKDGFPSSDIFCMGNVDLRKMNYAKYQVYRVVSFASLGQRHEWWEIPSAVRGWEVLRRSCFFWVDFPRLHDRLLAREFRKGKHTDIVCDVSNFSWCRREWYVPTTWETSMVPFEDELLPVIADAPQLLSHHYGRDWMKSVEKRDGLHTHVANRLVAVVPNNAKN